MGALLIYDITSPKSIANPANKLGNAMDLMSMNAFHGGGTEFTCFTGTKVQILTQKTRQPCGVFTCTPLLEKWRCSSSMPGSMGPSRLRPQLPLRLLSLLCRCD